MKRILSSAIILIMIFAFATPCLAAKDALTNDKLSASMNVEAKYVFIYTNEEGYTTIQGENGHYSDTTKSGLKVEMTIEPEEGKEALVLVVHEITESDEKAAKWFKETFRGEKNVAPVEIFFADANGNRYEIPKGTEIILTGLKTEHQVYRISADGTKHLIPGNVVDGKFKVTVMGANEYFVVVTPGDSTEGGESGSEQQPEAKPEQPDQPEAKPEQPDQKPDQPEAKPDQPEAKPEQPDQKPDQKPEEPPKTGDDFNLILWFALMALSIIGIVIVGNELKKSK